MAMVAKQLHLQQNQNYQNILLIDQPSHDI